MESRSSHFGLKGKIMMSEEEQDQIKDESCAVLHIIVADKVRDMLVSASGVEDVIPECLHQRTLPFLPFSSAYVVGSIGFHTRHCMS